MSNNKETNIDILDDNQTKRLATGIFKNVLQWIKNSTKSIVKNT